MILRVNRDYYFLKHRQQINLCNGEVLFFFAVRTEFLSII
jgi:hypothetical protein